MALTTTRKRLPLPATLTITRPESSTPLSPAAAPPASTPPSSTASRPTLTRSSAFLQTRIPSHHSTAQIFLPEEALALPPFLQTCPPLTPSTSHSIPSTILVISSSPP